MKNNRFLIIAVTLSILLHILVFIFVPDLKSGINSNDYLKRITKISIFSDDRTTKLQDNKNSATRRDNRTTKQQNNKNGTTRRDNKTTKLRNNENDNARRDDKTAERQNNENDNARRDDRTTEQQNNENGNTRRDDRTTEQQNNENGNARRNDRTAEQQNNENGNPKTSGELAFIPKALNPKTPDYPETLEEEGIEGTVTLELLISKEGKVLDAKIIKSDHELFSESALRTVKNYKFSPGKLKDGSAADSLIEFVIKFEISL